MTENDTSPLTIAMAAQDRLGRALLAAGFQPDEFQQMYADLDPFDIPQVNLGRVTADTADRLTHVISRCEP